MGSRSVCPCQSGCARQRMRLWAWFPYGRPAMRGSGLISPRPGWAVRVGHIQGDEYFWWMWYAADGGNEELRKHVKRERRNSNMRGLRLAAQSGPATARGMLRRRGGGHDRWTCGGATSSAPHVGLCGRPGGRCFVQAGGKRLDLRWTGGNEVAAERTVLCSKKKKKRKDRCQPARRHHRGDGPCA